MRSKPYAFIIFMFLCVTVQYTVIHAKRILVITNISRYSHQITYRGLLLELHRRGHEIVWITPNPIKNSSMTNFREIDLNYFYNGFPEFKEIIGSFNEFNRLSLESTFFSIERKVWELIYILNHEVFKNPEVQKLYAADSGEHFDAVIVGQGPTSSMNAFAHRFNAPLIGISSLDVFNTMRYTLGSVILPSHISNWQIDTTVENDISFWRRLINFCLTWKQIYYWMSVHAPMEDALARKYLGNDIPYIDDITRNMSIYFVNRHPVITHPRPEQGNVIFFQGFHIAKVPPALPKDLQRFLDDAKDGFIYISFGSGVEWEYLPNNVLEKFIDALTTLPYRILWKINADLLPHKFEHIMASKWLPQQSILAHPNIRLFIYQGGLQSTEETIWYGVPIVGYPIVWDQEFQIRNMISWGAGVHLRHDTISKETIQAAMYEVMTNKRYKNKIMEISRRYHDKPYDSLEYAARWVEYVIRQNGTPFLRDSLGDKPWYQRFDWDIIAFLAVVAFIAGLSSLYILFRSLRFVYRYHQISYDNSQYRNVKSKVQ